MNLDDLKHAQRERLIFLDQCLTWRGMANRRDLVERFGISTAQAALDFRTYLSLSRATPPIYDPVRKTYFVSEAHVPLVPSNLAQAFGALFDDEEHGLPSALPRPNRCAEPKVIARLYQAIKSESALYVRYTSMTSGADGGQWLAPTRFISDGEVVHVRAFSFKHNEFRNYLPVRIEADSTFEEKSRGDALPEDGDWNTKVIIWLRPKSSLSGRQADVVRREYGFDGEFLRVETRKALEFFFDRRWGLDQKGARLERAKTEYKEIGSV